MKKVLTLAVMALVISAWQPVGASMAAGTVKVTVTYKGKGTVDASHRLWVWLFDTPNIGAGSMPIDQVALDKNGGVAEFANVADEVYVAVAFDESGGITGDGPPPPGTPIGLLIGPGGTPAGVTPGEKGVATITFDDSMRMP